MIHYMIRWLSMAWGAFLPHLNLWTTPPPPPPPPPTPPPPPPPPPPLFRPKSMPVES
ncbi:hypothetical protein DES29_1291, partial [Sutterella wadsworthensis]